MKIDQIRADAVKLREHIRERLDELEPLMMEFDILSEQMEIIEAADEAIAKAIAKAKKMAVPAPTKVNVEKWARALGPDEVVKAGDLAAAFGKYDSWARNHLNRMVTSGLMEKWGKGDYRLKPDRSGAATLRVVTAG